MLRIQAGIGARTETAAVASVERVGSSLMKRRVLAHGLLTAPFWALGAAMHARAQPAARAHRIGVLSLNLSASETGQFERAMLRTALREAGLEEGRNLQIEWRHAEADVARLAGLADELVRLDVKLILAVTNDPLEAAMRATQRIPIVVIAAVLPVELGYVRSLAYPGGNVTGTTWASIEVTSKALQILREAAPRITRVAILANPAAPGTQQYRAENARAALALGLSIEVFDIGAHESPSVTLQRVAASRPDALFVAGGGVAGTQLAEIVGFAQRNRLPAIGFTPYFIPAGGTLYYGPNLAHLGARTASFVTRILSGAAAADLPMEGPTKFDLVINQRGLKAIGVSVPASLLLRADNVIE